MWIWQQGSALRDSANEISDMVYANFREREHCKLTQQFLGLGLHISGNNSFERVG